MPRRLTILAAIFLAAVVTVQAGRNSRNSSANLPSAADPGPPAYELSLHRYSDSFGTLPVYVFTIGDIAYKSVDALKLGISQLPQGALLQWVPGRDRYGGEPLLSNDADMKAFSDYCASLGIHFVLVPSD
ncbi:hypothetical protein BH09VER1_BH09VER1_43910 [soil metagenome]